MSRLLLVRHGPSAHVHDGSWIDAEDARRFEALYDAAPIRDEAPPSSLIDIARTADVILASDLLRAIMSARAIAPGREPVLSPLLRELKFNLPGWGPKLPVGVWDGLHYLIWSARLLARARTQEMERAGLAADWVSTQAPNDGITIAVTHGGFRRLLSSKLAQRGWSVSPGPRRYHNWSVWEHTRIVKS